MDGRPLKYVLSTNQNLNAQTDIMIAFPKTKKKRDEAPFDEWGPFKNEGIHGAILDPNRTPINATYSDYVFTGNPPAGVTI